MTFVNVGPNLRTRWSMGYGQPWPFIANTGAHPRMRRLRAPNLRERRADPTNAKVNIIDLHRHNSRHANIVTKYLGLHKCGARPTNVKNKVMVYHQSLTPHPILT